MLEPGSAHHRMLKTLMGGPMGGNVGAQEHPPLYVEDIDGGTGAPLAGFEFHLLSQHSLAPARSSIESSSNSHGVPFPGPPVLLWLIVLTRITELG
jgi:hypothetical protein